MQRRESMMRNRKETRAVSEVVASVILILITLSAMSYVIYYFMYRYYEEGAGLNLEANRLILSSGQIISTLYVYNNGTDYVFYFEDIGNFKLDLQGVCYMTGGKLVNISANAPIYNYSSVVKCAPTTIWPREVYWIVLNDGELSSFNGILYLKINGVFIQLQG
ncbi:hypothetical protein HS7_12720 [Sulfolobales archaeon HS-7]|nr:hypothetical protein HS7_12720 [Sulfolobales archaeon HS-7]